MCRNNCYLQEAYGMFLPLMRAKYKSETVSVDKFALV